MTGTTGKHSAEAVGGAHAPTGRGTFALLGVAALGAAVAIALGVYGRVHEPTLNPISTLGFNSMFEMKSWTATFAGVLALFQVVTAAGMWGKLPGVSSSPGWLAPVHRWSGTVAFLMMLPAAYHCLWALGFQTHSTRAIVHSALGCVFFGVFASKMLALRVKSLPGWALPWIGGLLFAVFAGVWSTSSLWWFTGGAH